MKYTEDALFRDMTFPKASIIVLIPKISYHYRNIRIGSIENSLKNIERLKSVIKGLNYLFKYYEKNNYYEFMKLILKNWIKGCYNHIKSLTNHIINIYILYRFYIFLIIN